MRKQSELIRYHFTLTDEEGYVLLSSSRLVSAGENIFTLENFSASDIDFATRRLREYKHEHVILLRGKRDGCAVFICPYLFPSTRTVVALYTDIKYSVAATLCGLYHSDVALRVCPELNNTREHERAYGMLESVLFSLKTMFFAEYYESASYSFGRYLRDKVEEIARLTFCQTELCFESEYTISEPEGFDGGMLGLFLLLMLSAASDVSPLRRAEVSFTELDSAIYVQVIFDIPQDKRAVADMDKRFGAAVRRLDDACARLNMPMYHIKDGVLKTGMIPVRADASSFGLKAGKGYLKDEEQSEDYERNIFAPLPPAADK